MKRILIASAVLALLALAPAAQADVVQEFTFELKNVRTWGGFTVVYTGRSYDTTGAKPPPVTRSYYRLPAGAKLRRLFLRKKRFLCNAKYLNESKNPDDCKRARIGSGRVLVDIRPFLAELIPADFYLFLSKPEVRGAVATFTVLGIPDVTIPVVRDNWSIRNTKPVLAMNMFEDSTPDGRYGYRLEIPTVVADFAAISIAEVKATSHGLVSRKRVRRCVKRKRGRCVKRRRKLERTFWFTKPTCPASGDVSFLGVFEYDVIPTITHLDEVPCPRFKGAGR